NAPLSTPFGSFSGDPQSLASRMLAENCRWLGVKARGADIDQLENLDGIRNPCFAALRCFLWLSLKTRFPSMVGLPIVEPQPISQQLNRQDGQLEPAAPTAAPTSSTTLARLREPPLWPPTVVHGPPTPQANVRSGALTF